MRRNETENKERQRQRRRGWAFEKSKEPQRRKEIDGIIWEEKINKRRWLQVSMDMKSRRKRKRRKQRKGRKEEAGAEKEEKEVDGEVDMWPMMGVVVYAAEVEERGQEEESKEKAENEEKEGD